MSLVPFKLIPSFRGGEAGVSRSMLRARLAVSAYPPMGALQGAKRNPKSMGLRCADSWKPAPVLPFQPIARASNSLYPQPDHTKP